MLVTNTIAVGSFTLEAFIYGIYLILFGCTLCFLWKRRQYSTRGTLIVIGGALCLLFVLGTAHIVMSLCVLFLHVLTAAKMSSGFQYYGRSTVYLTMFSKGVWIAMMIVADSLVAWRGWVLWNRRSWIVYMFVPLEILLLVCAICHTHVSLQPSNISPNPVVVAWYMALCFMSLSTNILASGLISFRLYQAGSRIACVDGRIRAKRYRSLLWIYLESGSIYPTVLIICFSLFFSDSPFWWLAISISPQIAGMMPTIMILAVLSAGYSLSESSTMDSHANRTSYRLDSQSRRTNGGLLITTELPSQLTDLEVVSEELNFTGPTASGNP